MKKLILSCLFATVSIVCQAQQYISTANGYSCYNFFDDLTAAGFSPSPAASTSNVVFSPLGTAGTPYLASSNTGYCLTSKNQTTAGNTKVTLVTSPSYTTLSANDWEWSFLYKCKNASLITNVTTNAVVGNTANSWKYWLHHVGSTISTSSQGWYVTQTADGKLRVFVQNGGSSAEVLTSATALTNGVTYCIKIQRLATSAGFWRLYLDPYTSTVQSAKTPSGTSSPSDVQVIPKTYTNSIFECQNTTGNDALFQWDEVHMYTRYLGFTGITSTSNGISAMPLIPGQTNAIVYGLQLNMRGNYLLGSDFYINTSQSGYVQGNFASAAGPYTFYKTTSSTFSIATATAAGTMQYYNSGVAQSADLNDQWASAGNTDGTLTIPGYYFFTVNVASSITTGLTFSFGSINTIKDKELNNNITGTAFTAAPAASVVTFANPIDWTGATSSAWALASNWTPAQIPTSTDIVRIGVKSQTISGSAGFLNQPIVTDARSVASLTIGTQKAVTLTMTNATLTVAGSLTQNHNSATGGITTSITGTGTGALTAASLNVGDNTAPPGPNGEALGGGLIPTENSTILNLSVPTVTINGNVTLQTTSSPLTNYTIFGAPYSSYCVNNAYLNHNSGIITANNIVTTNAAYVNRTAFSVNVQNYATFQTDITANATTLNLLGATPVTTATGGLVDFNAGGSGGGTVNYAATSGTQTVYTGADASVDNATTVYNNLTLSGAATKSPTGGALTVSGAMTTSGGAVSLMNDPTITVTGAWTNSAAVTHDTGPITVNGGFTNTGTFTGGGGTIGTTTLANSGTFTGGSGAITASGLTTITAGTFTTGSGLFTAGGGISNTTGTFQQGSGNIAVTSGSTGIALTSGIMNFSAGSVAVNQGVTLTAGTLNAGTGALTIGTNLQINGGTFNAGASPGTIAVTGTFSNAGTYTGSTGNLDVNGTTFTNTGTLTLAGGIATIASGTFTNTSPGTFIASAGTVNFDGTAQNIINTNTTTPVTFQNITLSTSSAKTLNNGSQTGKFKVNSTGTVTLAGTATFATGTALLTLSSDANGTARVAALTSTTNVISGTLTVERYFTGGSISNRGWRMLSYPVNNSGNTLLAANGNTATTAAFNFNSLKTNLLITGVGGSSTGFDQPSGYTTNGSTILYYSTIATGTGSTFTWPTSLLTTPTRPVGSGFYFYFRGNNTTNPVGKVIKSAGVYTAPEANIVGLQTGTLNQQAFRYTLSNVGRAFNLVGNPYPSSISLTAASLTGTTGFVYTYTPGGTSITTSPVATVIASGQAFFVKSNTTPTYISFTENLKSTTQLVAPSLLMGLPVETEEPLITLKMIQDSTNWDITYLRYLDSYKDTFYDMEDAEDLDGPGQSALFSALTSDKKLVAIASQPLAKQRTSVFLSVDDSATGIYTLKRTGLVGIPMEYDVYLMDHFKKDSLDLRANDTYNFNLDKNNTATFGTARFEVVVRKKILPPYKLISFAGQKSGTKVSLRWDTQNEFDYTSFELQKSYDNKTFDAVRNMRSSSSGTYTYTDAFLATDTKPIYYRLKQTDIYDNVTYSNVVIIVTRGDGNFSIFPNPATNAIQFALNKPFKSQVSLRIYNSMGVLMKTGTFTATTGQQDISSLTTGSYTIEITDVSTKEVVLTGKFVKL